MSAPKLILASASPRRVELLGELGVPFQVVPSQASELHDHSIPASEICVVNAGLKAAWVAERYPNNLVLGADTLVTYGGKLFGKPASLQEAEEMLAELEGETHEVITGCSFLHHARNVKLDFAVSTWVTFKSLSREDIREYISKVYVLDKAGAYAIQDHCEMIISSISSSYTNVVGLPVERVKTEYFRVLGFFTDLL